MVVQRRLPWILKILKLNLVWLVLYCFLLDNVATIASYSKLENNSNQEVVIQATFLYGWFLPAAYEIVTLQGAYAREKTVRRQQVEQGILSPVRNRGALVMLSNTSSSIMWSKELQILGMCLLYNWCIVELRSFCPKESTEWSLGGYWD